MALNPKQIAFARYYAQYKNATKAAKKAGYAKASAGQQANDLLKNPEIQKLVQESLKKIAKKAELKASDVLKEIRKHAFVDFTKALADDGTLLNPKDMPEDVRKSLVSFELVEEFEGSGRDKTQIGWTKKLRSTDKIRALEMLAKHFKLLTDIVQHEGGEAPLVVLTMPANGSEAAGTKTSSENVDKGKIHEHDSLNQTSAETPDTDSLDSSLESKRDGE